jgi:hypothetical protein
MVMKVMAIVVVLIVRVSDQVSIGLLIEAFDLIIEAPLYCLPYLGYLAARRGDCGDPASSALKSGKLTVPPCGSWRRLEIWPAKTTYEMSMSLVK